MSSLLGNFSVATTTNNVFTGTALNDILLTAQSNQKIWIGGASGASNVLSVGSNVTTTSNLEVTGLTSLSNLVVTGTVVGFNGVSSNQSFSNVWSSNVYGSNAAFSNLIISSSESNNGSLSVAGVLRSATLSNTGVLSNAGVALFSSNVGIGLAAPQYPLDVVGNANFSGNISAGNLGMFRNRIINGHGIIDQRATLNTPKVVGATGRTYGVDGWYAWTARYSSFGLTTQQVVDAPSGMGLTNSIRYSATAAISGGTTSYLLAGVIIEGHNISDFMWGTSQAVSLTLSFWVKSSRSGTFTLCIETAGEISQYLTTYTVSAANTWQKVSLVIPPNTSDASNSSNGDGMYIHLVSQGTYPSMNAGWRYNVGIYSYSVTSSTSALQSNDDTIQFTGVQLEKGTIATPFEFRPFAVELQLCQRYFQSIAPYTVGGVCSSANNGTIPGYLSVVLPITMRSAPKCTTLSSQVRGITGFTTLTNVQSTVSYSFNAELSLQGYGNAPTIGASFMIAGNENFNAPLLLSAEL